MSAPYTVIPVVAAEVGATLVSLWSKSFENLRGEQAEKKYEHFYLRNPVGSGVVFLLRDNRTGADVGVQALVLRRFFKDGKSNLAGNMADYTVDQAHRSLGPALQLMKASIASSKTNLAFLYGLPNRKSEPILRRVGLEPVLEMARYAALLRSRHYLEHRLPVALLGPVSLVTDVALDLADRLRTLRGACDLVWGDGQHACGDIDTIWQAAGRSGLMMSERTAMVLQWRYETQTSSAWRIDVAYDRRTNKPVGYIAWTLRSGVAVVGDFLAAQLDRGLAPLLAAFRCRARALGAVAITLEYCGSPAVAAALADVGLRQRESSPVYAVINQTLAPSEEWYLTGFDRDTD